MVARTAAAKTGTGTAAGAVATVALADAVAPAAPAAAAAAASPPPPSASNSEPVETGSDWEIPSRLSFQPMAPRSVWNLGLRPQPVRPLAGSSHSRAISLPLIGQMARQSHLKAPHEPAASAPASFQQRFARRVGEGKWGGSKRSEEGGGGGGGGTKSRAEQRRERGEAARRIGSSELSINRSPPSTSRPLPPLPLPVLSPQARPFRPAHRLGAFGDGEGGAPLVSWWWREFERGARRLPSASSDPGWPAPAGSRQPAGPEPAGIGTRPSDGGRASKREGTPSCFFTGAGREEGVERAHRRLAVGPGPL